MYTTSQIARIGMERFNNNFDYTHKVVYAFPSRSFQGTQREVSFTHELPSSFDSFGNGVRQPILSELSVISYIVEVTPQTVGATYLNYNHVKQASLLEL